MAVAVLATGCADTKGGAGEADMSISEVASKCGFSRSTYFSTSFRQCFGMSPSDYRQNAMEREEEA